MGSRARTISGMATLVVLVAAPAADADFHLMNVREVYPGSTSNPTAEYVELQMYDADQNFVAGHAVTFYNAAGGQTAAAAFMDDEPNGANQASILIGTAAAQTQFGLAPDLAIAAGLDPAGGAACFSNIDCVAWGGFSGALPSTAGTPASAIPDGQALCRTISRGDPGRLEAVDDTSNSLADFSAAPPAPRNNDSAASRGPCSTTPTGGAGGGGGAGSDTNPPNTTITKGPKGEVDTDTVRFRFESDEAGSTFECRTPGKPFRRCRSPKRLRNLDDGKQRFKVRAIDRSGNVDPTPAKRRFRVDT